MARNGGQIVNRTSQTDNYSTPIVAIKALLHYEDFSGGVVLEPAVGEGNIAKVFSERYGRENVVATDLRPKEEIWGDANLGSTDFLTDYRDNCATHMVTNPPFTYALEFAQRGIEVVQSKLALFVRIQFHESEKRYPFHVAHPARRIYTFTKRVACYPEGQENKGGGTIMYCWYVWEKGYRGNPELIPIDPELLK